MQSGAKGRKINAVMMAGGPGFEPRLTESESSVIFLKSTAYARKSVKPATGDQYLTRELSNRDGPPRPETETAAQAGPLNGGEIGKASSASENVLIITGEVRQ